VLRLLPDKLRSISSLLVSERLATLFKHLIKNSVS
jgi:hypothetical protein